MILYLLTINILSLNFYFKRFIYFRKNVFFYPPNTKMSRSDFLYVANRNIV